MLSHYDAIFFLLFFRYAAFDAADYCFRLLLIIFFAAALPLFSPALRCR